MFIFKSIQFIFVKFFIPFQITTNLSSTSIKEDNEYLNGELDEATEILNKSEDRFETCIDDLRNSYEKSFAGFQQASLTCMVS